jgi:CRISPR/Cas system-associated protein endoribonuclease Cas2
MGQGRNGTVTRKLSALEDEYGTEALKTGVLDTIASGRIQLSVLARILAENAQMTIEAHQIDIVLPDKPHIRNLSIDSPDLATYDEL